MTQATTDNPALKSAVKKASRRLLPFLMLLYFINYLDRTNIGFAGPGGMNEALGLTATAFGFAAGIFFVGYLLLEVPSNLALHKFGARRWIARIMISWGIVAAGMAFVPNAGWLYAMRFLLGVAEAGFFPGIILYLTYWFPAKQRARATALFMAAVPLSAAIGAPVSSALIVYADGLFGLEGWRSMFLLEGIPAILLGIVCWFYLTDRPTEAAWLDPDEQQALDKEIAAEESGRSRDFHVSIRQSLTQGRVWALAFVYFGIVYGLYALSFFLPTIISGFEQQFGTSYTLMERGLITSIPYVVATAAMIWWGRHGDRTGERTWHVAGPALVGGIAIPIALYLNSPLTAMIAVTVCAVGVMCALPTFWSLPTAFLAGAAAASGIALINSVGNSAGFVAPYITGWLADLTGSQKTGLWVVGAAMVSAAIIAVALRAKPRVDNDVLDKEPGTGDHPSVEQERGKSDGSRPT